MFRQEGLNDRSPPIAGNACQATDLTLSFVGDPDLIREKWLEFERTAVCTFFQTHHWLSHWSRYASPSYGETPFIVIGTDATGQLALIWPMAKGRSMGATVLTWLGQSYNTYNMGIFRRGVLRALGPDDVRAILSRIVEANPDIDAFNFYHQPAHWDGLQNPFALLPGTPSYLKSYVVRLEQDFENFCKSRVSKKFQAKVRRMERRLAETGQVECLLAQTPEERLAVFESFLRHKDYDLSRLGVSNAYRNPGLARFLREIITCNEQEECFEVTSLTVDCDRLATIIGANFKQKFVCLILSMDNENPLAKWSPGSILIHDRFRNCHAQGTDVIDMGIGEGHHKNAWRPDELPMFNTHFAARFRGWPYSAGLLLSARARRFMRNNPYAWAVARRARDAARAMRSLYARYASGRN